MAIALGTRIGLGFAGSQFSPLALGPFVWLRSDLGITLNSTTVAAWADQSGNGHNVSQGTGANQPTYNASDANYNGRPSLQAATSGHFLLSAAFSIPQPFSLFIVGEAATSGQVLIGCGTASDPFVGNNAGNTEVFAGTTQVTDPVSCTVPRSMLAVFNGASSFAGADDWVTGGSTGGSGTLSLASLNVFATSAGTFSLIGKVLEIVGLPRVPTANDKALMQAYIKTLYNRTVT